MQNRPFQSFQRSYEPIPREADFPVNHFFHSPPPEKIESLHLHDCLEIGLCRSGSGIFIVEDKVMPFQAGDISIIGQTEFHKAQSFGRIRSEWYFIQFQPAQLFAASSGEDESDPGGGQTDCSRSRLRLESNLLDGNAHAFLKSVLEQLCGELENHPPFWREAALGLLRWITSEIERLSDPGKGNSPESSTPLRRSSIERLGPALRMIADGYPNPNLSIPQLAQACGMSLTHFRRVFRSTFRKSPLKYLTDYRMRMGACLLQREGCQVMEAASAVGYGTPSSFHRHFKETHAEAPKKYAMRSRQGKRFVIPPRQE